MAKGDCIYIDAIFLKVVEPPKVFQESGDCIDCCYTLPVFWSDDNNDLYHDKSSWVWFVDKNAIDTCVMTLERNEIEVDTLNDGTLGTLYPLGFIDNRLDQKAIAYELDWNLVYSLHGNGKYRIKIVQTDVIGTEKIEYSPVWNLRKYADLLADETIRVDFKMNGQIGWFGEEQVDFLGNDFYMQFRLPSSNFGQRSDDLAVDNRRFENGATMQISKIITDKFKLEVREAPEFIHQILQVTLREALFFTVTDYKFCAKNIYTTERAVFISGHAPEYNNVNDRSTVLYDLEEYVKNKITYR